jgi:hypothetical protein
MARQTAIKRLLGVGAALLLGAPGGGAICLAMADSPPSALPSPSTFCIAESVFRKRRCGLKKNKKNVPSTKNEEAMTSTTNVETLDSTRITFPMITHCNHATTRFIQTKDRLMHMPSGRGSTIQHSTNRFYPPPVSTSSRGLIWALREV